MVRGQRTYSLLQFLCSMQIFRFNNYLFVVILRKPKLLVTNAVSDKACEYFLLQKKILFGLSFLKTICFKEVVSPNV